MLDGTNKDFYLAGIITKNEEKSTADSEKYDFVVYADVDDIYTPPQAQHFFYNLTSLEDINLKVFNTSETHDMSSFFSKCTALTDISAISQFDTSNLLYADYIFSNCLSLTSVDLKLYSNFRFKKWMSGTGMFNNCTSLEYVDITDLDGSNLTRMEYMFFKCHALKELNLSNITSTSITNIYAAFYEMPMLKTLNISNLDLSSVDNDTNLNPFFGKNTSLEVIYTPSAMPEGKTIALPEQFGETVLSSANTSQRLSLIPSKFIAKWQSLRVAGNGEGICAALVKNSEGRTTLESLIKEYDAMVIEDQTVVNEAWDVEEDNVKIIDTINYVKAVIAGMQKTDKDYNGNASTLENTFVISSQNKSAIIVLTSVVGMQAIVAYYFIEKRKISGICK